MSVSRFFFIIYKYQMYLDLKFYIRVTNSKYKTAIVVKFILKTESPPQIVRPYMPYARTKYLLSSLSTYLTHRFVLYMSDMFNCLYYCLSTVNLHSRVVMYPQSGAYQGPPPQQSSACFCCCYPKHFYLRPFHTINNEIRNLTFLVVVIEVVDKISTQLWQYMY